MCPLYNPLGVPEDIRAAALYELRKDDLFKLMSDSEVAYTTETRWWRNEGRPCVDYLSSVALRKFRLRKCRPMKGQPNIVAALEAEEEGDAA